MTSSSETRAALEELDKRMMRLERNPGGLSPQDQSRIEREFGRLEQQIRELEERMPRLPTGWLLAGLLLIGLVVGAGAGYVLFNGSRGTASRDGANGAKAGATVELPLKQPKDLQRFLGYQTNEDAILLRYRNVRGEMKVAVYPYGDGGEPSVIFRLPQEAAAAGGRATELSGEDTDPSGGARPVPRTKNRTTE